jgi:hypothetical protein
MPLFFKRNIQTFATNLAGRQREAAHLNAKTAVCAVFLGDGNKIAGKA